jgi:GNAT superfamily N-acetyltransferase
MVVQVREVDLADAPAVAEVMVAGWRAAYRGLVPDEHLAAMDPRADTGRFRAMWAAATAPDAPRTIVACTAGTVIGFASWGPYRPQPNHCGVGAGTPTPGARAVGELYALYAHPEHWGTGAGHALTAEVLREMQRQGLAPVRLWVFTGNARARQFYERSGFRPDGAHALFHVEEARVPEVRYTRE